MSLPNAYTEVTSTSRFHPSMSNLRSSPRSQSISNCQYFDGLADWVKLMEEFRDLVVQHIPQTSVGEPHNSNIQLTLLRSLVRTISSQKKAKISTNLLAGAVHLAFLKSSVQNKLVLELPDDPLSFTQRLIVPMHS